MSETLKWSTGHFLANVADRWRGTSKTPVLAPKRHPQSPFIVSYPVFRCGKCNVINYVWMEKTNGVEINACWRTERGLLIPINTDQEFGKVAMLISYMTSTNENALSQEALKAQERFHAKWHKWHDFDSAIPKQRIMDNE